MITLDIKTRSSFRHLTKLGLATAISFFFVKFHGGFTLKENVKKQ